MTADRSLYARFEGGWCDNCRTAFPYIPRDGNCPSCGPVALRPARITVEPHDSNPHIRNNQETR